MGHPFSRDWSTAGLSEFGAVFEGDLVNLVAGELFGRGAGRGACLAEEAVEAGGRDDPEQEKLMIGVGESVPVVLGDEDG